MPRNIAGVYTLPAGINPVVAGTVIMDTWANPTLDDIAAAITDSLDRAGRGGMTGAFKMFDGTVGLPGLGFDLEPSTGLYRVGAGSVGVSVLGVKVLGITASGLAVIGGLDVTGDALIAGGVTIDGVVTAGFGVVGAPGFAFTGDLNTGMWRPAADMIAWSVGGAEGMRIDGTGLGIHQTDPQALLHVGNAAAAVIRIGGSGASDWAHFGNTATEAYIYTPGATDFLLYTNNVVRLAVTSDGRVYGKALHNNAGSVAGAVNQYIASGTYTPTFAAVSGIASGTVQACQWIRVGNVVMVSGQITPNASGAGSAAYTLTLPIATTMTNAGELAGTAGHGTASADISKDGSGALALFSFVAAGAGAFLCPFSFSYLVK